MRATAQCRSCQAPIVWVMTTGGKRMPIDAEANPDGNVWIDHYAGGKPVVGVAATPGRVPSYVPNRYTSHFTTCPQAAEWRGKPGPGPESRD